MKETRVAGPPASDATRKTTCRARQDRIWQNREICSIPPGIATS